MMTVSLPPGLSDTDIAESATVSRERRRVALTATAAVNAIDSRLSAIEVKLDMIINGESKSTGAMTPIIDQRLSRLETVLVCSPNPTVDEVLEEMCSRRTQLVTLSSKCGPILRKGSLQPEQELLPGKDTSQFWETPSSLYTADRCMEFDISSEGRLECTNLGDECVLDSLSDARNHVVGAGFFFGFGPRTAPITSAITDTAISAGVCAPISTPIGHLMRAISAAVKPASVSRSVRLA